jgi:hypothetical protein
MLNRVLSVRLLGNFRLNLRFTDGLSGDVGLRDEVVGRGGVFAALEEVGYFARVYVDPESGTIAWPNGVDLDPDVLYSRATGRPLPANHPAPA